MLNQRAASAARKKFRIRSKPTHYPLIGFSDRKVNEANEWLDKAIAPRRNESVERLGF